MSVVTQWDIEKCDLAAQLYAALAALVGDVDALHLTEASLSWRTTSGVQGHWREAQGQFWLGRIVWAGEGRRSEQLVLRLDRLGEEGACLRVAHPTAHHCRSAEGPPVGVDPDTPQIYAAALALVMQLGEELHTMLPSVREEGQGKTADDEEATR